MELGDIPGRDDPGFKPWPGTVTNEVMTRFVDRFVEHYDDPTRMAVLDLAQTHS